MFLSTPAHKQTDPAKAPGQIVNRDFYKRAMFMAPSSPGLPKVMSLEMNPDTIYKRLAKAAGVSADEKQLVANIGTSNALANDGTELEGSTCD